MNDLNEIDFADAAIHRLQRMGASDDYEKYVAEIEAHEKQQNTLEQLQRQREQLAEQMAQISLQMETLDEQIREVQEVAQAPPAEPQAVNSEDEYDHAVTVANRLSQMDEEDREQELMFMQEGDPHLAELVFANLAKIRRQAAPEPYEELAKLADSHNDKEQLAELERQREGLVTQLRNADSFTVIDGLQKQIHEIDLQLHQLEDHQEPEADEEIALHLGSVRRRANPEPYQELSEHFTAQERIEDLERQQETQVKQIPHAESFEAQNELQRQIQEIDIELNDFADPEPIENTTNEVETNDKISNRTAQPGDDLNAQKAEGVDGSKPRIAESGGQPDKADRRADSDRKSTSAVSDNNHNAAKTTDELPPLSKATREEFAKLKNTKARKPVQRSAVKPKRPPDFNDQEVRRNAIQMVLEAIKKLIGAILGFGPDVMEGHRPAQAAGPGGPRM